MKIIFFDGYCSLCNGFVDWLIARDRKGVLKFASLQSETAQKVLLEATPSSVDPETVVYFREGKTFERSNAVLMVFQDLGGFWKLTGIFFVIPRVFRDVLYRIVAKNRYRLFGKRDTCRLPTPAEKDRLLS